MINRDSEVSYDEENERIEEPLLIKEHNVSTLPSAPL